MSELYDRIAPSYMATRREDPRLAVLIRDALGPDVRTVINVGAGAGAYEPRDLDVTAVEPTAAMRANRPPGATATWYRTSGLRHRRAPARYSRGC